MKRRFSNISKISSYFATQIASQCWANVPTKSIIYQLSANSFTKDLMLTKLTGATVAQWSRWLVKLLPLITVAIHHCSVGSSLSLVIVQNDQAWAWLAMLCPISRINFFCVFVSFVFWTFRNARLLVSRICLHQEHYTSLKVFEGVYIGQL
jgi:hypothetical protein